MRTELSFKLVCSVCQSTLEADIEKKEDTVNSITRIKCGSAFKCGAVMAIKPCAKCYSEAGKAARLIKQALAEVGNG